jgi:hypothetical protein
MRIVKLVGRWDLPIISFLPEHVSWRKIKGEISSFSVTQKRFDCCFFSQPIKIMIDSPNVVKKSFPKSEEVSPGLTADPGISSMKPSISIELC